MDQSKARPPLEPTRQSAWAPGTELPGEHVLVRRLSEGSMGQVWLGQSLRLDREVAIKLLLSERGLSETYAQLLAREARALARLRHPAVVRVFELGWDAGRRPFIVMEHLEGRDLRWVMQKRPRLQGTVAVSMLLPIARGLAAAHAEGIAHLDVKPENILLTHADEEQLLQPKLVDFGISVSKADEARLLMVSGTPAFMAPEQLEPERTPGPQADQFGLAATCYALLVGRSPFEGRTRSETFQALRTRAIPYPREVEMDARLFALLARACRKDPAQRFPGMGEFADALSSWLIDQGKLSDVSGRSLRRGHTTADVPFPNDEAPAPPPGSTPLSPQAFEAAAQPRGRLGRLDERIRNALSAED